MTMFQGHQMIKLCNDKWVFDLTEYIGYHVQLNKKGDVTGYKVAFRASYYDGEVVFEKEMRVSVKVLKEAASLIREYESEMNVNIEVD